MDYIQSILLMRMKSIVIYRLPPPNNGSIFGSAALQIWIIHATQVEVLVLQSRFILTESGLAFHKNIVYGKVLTAIETPEAKMEFIKGNDRKDLIVASGHESKRAKELSRIKITEGWKSNSNEAICKAFRLNFDYLKGNSRSLSNISNYDPDATYRYRLRLKEVVEESCTDSLVHISPFSFEYNENGKTVNGYPFFPNRLSNAIDHWGYYNGMSQNNNRKLNIPPTHVEVIHNQSSYFKNQYGSSDRNATDGEVSKLGVLKRVTYPSGGYTEYGFENNRVANLESPRRYKDLQSDWQMFSCNNPPNPSGDNGCPDLYALEQTIQFESTEDFLNGTYHFRLPYAGYVTTPSTAELTVWDGTNQIGRDVVTYDLNPEQHEYNHGEIALSELIPNFDLSKSYTVKLAGNGMSALVDFAFYPRFYEDSKDQPVGGLRVRSIAKYSFDGTKALEKFYSYNVILPEIGEISESSGTLMQQPIYLHTVGANVLQTDGDGTIFVGYDLTSSPIVPLSSFEGAHLFYSHVTEYTPGYGRIEMEFYDDLPIQHPYGSFPSTPTPPDFRRGEMMSKISYSENGDRIATEKYDRTQALIPVFNSGFNRPQIAYTFHQFGFNASGGCGLTPSKLGVMTRTYTVYTGYGKLNRQTNNTDEVEKITNYKYNSTKGYRYLTRETTENSNQDVIITNYRYPEHFSESVYRSMEDKNILSLIESSTTVNGILVDGKRTNYAEFGNDSHPYPGIIERFEATNNEDFDWNDGSWEVQGEIS